MKSCWHRRCWISIYLVVGVMFISFAEAGGIDQLRLWVIVWRREVKVLLEDTEVGM